MKLNWQTTVLGLAAILTAIGNAITAQLDDDPNTIPDWGMVLALLFAGLGLWRARDAAN